jgi:toxin-antitoxin system PIN domain toxin
MILLDVNVLVYAFNRSAIDHDRYAQWLTQVVNSPSSFGMSELVMSGFVRIVTHPRVFSHPASPQNAFDVMHRIRSRPNCVIVSPGPRHWEIFSELCLCANARGNLVPDAYLAALAIESGSEWITTDRGFARFPNLRFRHPLEHTR